MVFKNFRKDFPSLSTGIIYLDNASTSLTPKQVVEKMQEYYYYYRGNPLRSQSTFSRKVEEKLNEARKTLADFINAFPEEIVFVRNTTEAINLIARGLKLEDSGNIVVSAFEHASNYLPWLKKCQNENRKFEVVFPQKKEKILTGEDFAEKINKRTRVVSLAHVNNVLGTISPIEEVSEIAHENGAYFVLDAAQSAPHMPLDVKKLDVDFLAFSGHKICGPTGAGVLYIKRDLADKVEPLNYGGGAISDIELFEFEYAKGPHKFEAGTIAFCEVLAMAEGIKYVKNIGFENILKHDRKLIRYAYELLSDISNIRIYQPEIENVTSILTFNVGSVDPNFVSLMLDSLGQIEVRGGHLCAPIATKRVLKEKRGVVRISTYFYNTEEDIEKFAEAIRKIASAFH
jgi:cysteine desulfurase/selenocysteine lyase